MKLKAGFCVFALAAALASPAHSAGPTGMPNALNVNVTNTPLPVTGTIANTTDNPVLIRDVDASAKTHFGQPLQNHITLAWMAPGNQNSACTPNKEFRRIFPDGTIATETFVVPQGQMLVVTDLDANVLAGSGNTFELGKMVYAVLTPDNLTNSALVPHRTAGVLITNHDTQSITISSSLGSGVLIGAGRQACVHGESLSSIGSASFFRLDFATLRGYLISTSP